MIYTLTTNPAIDMNINTNGPIKKSIVNRCYGEYYSANGKGLNVSYVLKHYKCQSKILGFFGGFSGRYIVDTFNKKNNIEVDPVWIKGITRINVFLNDSINEFKMVNRGPNISCKEQEQLLNIIKNSKDMHCLSISGSLPQGIDTLYYDKIMKICNAKNIDVILDISNKHLKNLLKFKPYLIKPNDDEIYEIFGHKTTTAIQIKNALIDIYAKGAKNILLTLGDRGMYFYNGKNLFFAKAKPVKVLSSVCSGDSSLAAFISNISNNDNKMPNTQNLSYETINYAMSCACATGANVCESNGIGDLSKVSTYMKEVQFYKII